MKISVITVCRNSASTIRRSLESVATQSHPSIEHIVVDGASTDGTVAVINQTRQRVAHFVSEPDRGIYDALNKGLRVATGEIVGTLNADDVYADTNVLDLVARQFQDRVLDLLYGDVVYVRESFRKQIVRRYSSRRFSPSRIAWGWMPAHPAMFVAKSVFEKFGPYRSDYRIAGDYEFVARVFSHAPIKYKYINKVLVEMRVGGLTSGLRNRVLLNKEVLRACRENGIDTNYLKILSKYPAKTLELITR